MTAVSPAQVQSVVAFAAHLLDSLKQYQDGSSPSIPDSTPYIAILPFKTTEISKTQRPILRCHAIEIWNSCNALSVSDEIHESAELVQSRAFACLLLTSVVFLNKKRLATMVNLSKNALNAAKACIRASMFDLADKVIQSDSAMDHLSSKSREASGQQDTSHSVVVEYYCLRALLEWKRKRSDLSEHWYRQIMDIEFEIQESDAEKIIDVFYEFGRDCLLQSSLDTDSAVKWLERAQLVLDRQDVSHAFNGSDLRLSVMHNLVQALNQLPGDIHKERTQTLLSALRTEYGSKLPVSLLSLEMICAQAGSTFDPDLFASRLQEIISSVHLIDTNHRLVKHYINRLKDRSCVHAMKCLQTYTIHRLIPEEKAEWIEQAIVSYIDIASKNRDAHQPTALQTLGQDLDRFAEALKWEIRPCAAQAAHVLIWKMIRQTDADARPLAMSWCHVGLHRIFTSAGEVSIGKLQRQLISYHLILSHIELAYEMLEQMSFTQKNNRSSRYLAYCVAVRLGNDADAQSCLNIITNGQAENEQLLFACVGESIKYGQPLNTARLLQRILEKQLQNSQPGSNTGSLLQYTAQTLLQVVATWDSEHPLDQEILARLCSVFKHVVRLKDRQDPKGRLPPTIDVGWFGKCSWETAKTHVNAWPARYLLDLLDHCSQLCMFPADTMSEPRADQVSRDRLHDSMFMRAVIYASEARQVHSNFSVEDLPESSYDSRSKPKTTECQLILYQNVFKMFTELQKQINQLEMLDRNTLETVESLLHVLIPLAFEALLFMNVNHYITAETAFDELSIAQFLQTASHLNLPVANYALLADTLLAFACSDDKANGLRIPAAAAVRLLGKIVQALRRAQTYDMDQAARWIRCVAQLIFEDIDALLAKSTAERPPRTTQSLEMLDSVIQQAINLASQDSVCLTEETIVSAVPATAAPPNHLTEYPTEELQWLFTKMWNMAIDFHGIGESETARSWAEKAVVAAETLLSGDSNMRRFVEQMRTTSDALGWKL